MTNTTETPGTIEIDLRNPALAAFLGWLIPGAGHFYQRRFAKGTLFMVCILATYFFGLALGEGKVVYAQWVMNDRQQDRRWQYVCQVGVGLPALPAIIQSYRAPGKPDWRVAGSEWMMPPQVGRENQGDDELDYWHRQLKWKFELATLYTMIAGLLNILAVYDAFAGPFIATPEEPKRAKPDETA